MRGIYRYWNLLRAKWDQVIFFMNNYWNINFVCGYLHLYKRRYLGTLYYSDI